MKKMLMFIGVAVVIAGGVWYWMNTSYEQPDQQPTGQATPTPTSVVQNDEHLTIDETLRDVNFCGKVYKVKQIKIDGVDVVQRIAEIATKDLIPTTVKVGPSGHNMVEWQHITFEKGEVANGICNNMRHKGTDILIASVKSVSGTGVFQGSTVYDIFINDAPSFFIINPTNDVYIMDTSGGSMNLEIGTLK